MRFLAKLLINLFICFLCKTSYAETEICHHNLEDTTACPDPVDFKKLCTDAFQNKDHSVLTRKSNPKESCDKEIEEFYLNKARQITSYKTAISISATILAYASLVSPIMIYYFIKTRSLKIASLSVFAMITTNLVAANLFSFQIFSWASTLDGFYKKIFLNWLTTGWSKKPGTSIFEQLKTQSKALGFKYNDIKGSLPKNHLQAIEGRLDLLQKKIDQRSQTSSISIATADDNRHGDQTTQEMDVLIKSIITIFELARNVKTISFPSIKDHLDLLLRDYSPEVQENLRRFTGGIELASHSTSPDSFRSVIYFQGHSGTGRSYLARNYADVLGLPFIEMSFANVSLEEVAGQKSYAEQTLNNGPFKMSLFSKALSSLPQENKYINAIIFIRDFDKIFSNQSKSENLDDFFLNLFSKEKLNLQDLGVEVDISKTIFILSGSTPIKSQALREKIPTVSFGSVELNQRMKITCHYLGQHKVDSISNADLNSIINLVKIDDKYSIGVHSLLSTIDDFVKHRAFCKADLVFSKKKCEDFNFEEILEKNTRHNWNPAHALELFQKKFKVDRKLIPKSTKDVLEKHLAYLKSIDFSNNQFLGEKKDLSVYFRNLDYVLSLPRQARNIDSHKDEIYSQLASVLRNYSEGIKDKIGQSVKTHVLASSSHENDGLRTILYFFGIPGTGKTHLAKKLKEATGLSLVHISLAEASADDIVSQSSYTDYSQLNFGDGPPLRITRENGAGFGINNFWKLDKLTRLSQALVHDNGEQLEKNAILFFDEADKVLNDSNKSGLKSMMLSFLNPDQKEILLSDLGVKVDISQFLVILAGNETLHENALMDRVVSINFEGFDKKQKEEIAWERFQSFFKRPCLDHKICLTEEELGPHSAHLQKIKTFNKDHLTQDEKTGVRDILQKTSSYFNEIRASKVETRFVSP